MMNWIIRLKLLLITIELHGIPKTLSFCIFKQIGFVKYFIFFHVLSKQDSTKSIVRTKIFYLDY